MSKQTLYISANKGVQINPGMFGLFYEDINYCCDGGLNAEMIENPSFSFVEALGYNEHYSTKPDQLYGWIAYPSAGDGAVLSVGSENPVSDSNPSYLRFQPSESQKGFSNKAFDGIALKAGMSYTISAYLRSTDCRGKVTAFVYDGEAPALEVVLADGVTGNWKEYKTAMTAKKDTRRGRFVIYVEDCSMLEADFVSMKPDDAVQGVFRLDLCDMLKGMHPGFLRFPGGCVVEGNELSNRYQWKNTVGPLELRYPNWNRWAVHQNAETDFSAGPYSHYNQTCAIGYYEYFLLCEYIGAKPLPVQNVGLACQYQTNQRVEPEDPAFEAYIGDALDLIAFANAPENTKWGGLRAKMGHPAPFNLDMLGIGNEQWETEQSRFFERYARFEKAIHKEYPDIRLIGSAGPDVTSEFCTKAWNYYRKKEKEISGFSYAVDEHYYRPLNWMLTNDHLYDEYPRDVKVFAGEYAAHIESGMNMPQTNTLGAALAEAAFLTGVERNADVVVLASYAPLLARVGYAQWSPNLIWFDDSISYGTPSYYVQKLYAGSVGCYTVESCFKTQADNLYQIVSYDTKVKELIIKLVNAGDEPAEVELAFDQWKTAKEATAVVLTGEKTAYNSIGEPQKIIPLECSIVLKNSVYTAPASSFTVLRVRAD